jgi:hypothetical protein
MVPQPTTLQRENIFTKFILVIGKGGWSRKQVSLKYQMYILNLKSEMVFIWDELLKLVTFCSQVSDTKQVRIGEIVWYMELNPSCAQSAELRYHYILKEPSSRLCTVEMNFLKHIKSNATAVLLPLNRERQLQALSSRTKGNELSYTLFSFI